MGPTAPEPDVPGDRLWSVSALPMAATTGHGRPGQLVDASW